MDTPPKNEPQSMPSATSSPISTPSMAKKKLAADRARLLFGSYRKSDAHDPDTYALSIAEILLHYDDWIMCQATHPWTGIQRTEKFKHFPPNPGELADFCDDLNKLSKRYAYYDTLPKPDVPPLIYDDAKPADRPALPRERRHTLVELAERHADMTWAQNIIRAATSPVSTPEARLQACNDRLAATGFRLTQAEFDAIPDALPPSSWKKSA